MFAAQSACDDTLSGSIGNYNNITNFSPNQCNNQAQYQCQNSQDPNCYTNTYNTCHNTIVTTYDDRYGTYGSCVSGTINYSCYEEPDFCAAARERANQCAAMYPYEPGVINTAQMECRGASGIDQCE
jgi:carbohydrate-selective porin OprB